MKIMIALINGGLPIIKPETLDKMMQMAWAGKRQPGSDYTAKGLQLQITDYFDNRRLWGHFGDAYGVKSYFLFNQKEQIGMVYILNGGGYKYQENGYCDVHEKMIKATLDKYWHPEIASIFSFKVKEDHGYIFNRKIELDYKVTKNGVFFSKISLLDALGINTIDDYDFCNKDAKGMTLDEVVEALKEKYNFDLQKNDDTYMISYKNL